MKIKSVTYLDVKKTINRLMATFKKDFSEIDIVIGISRGGIFPAMHVSTRLKKSLLIVYPDKDNNFIYKMGLEDKKILIVDDICRTGKTMLKISKLLKDTSKKEIKTFTPYTLFDSEVEPTITSVITHDIKFPWNIK